MSEPVRVALLKEAARVTGADRQEQYGPPVASFRMAAEIYRANTGKHIAPSQVVQVMMAVKLARLRHDPLHRDSTVDLAAYAAILHECLLAECACDDSA